MESVFPVNKPRLLQLLMDEFITAIKFTLGGSIKENIK